MDDPRDELAERRALAALERDMSEGVFAAMCAPTKTPYTDAAIPMLGAAFADALEKNPPAPIDPVEFEMFSHAMDAYLARTEFPFVDLGSLDPSQL